MRMLINIDVPELGPAIDFYCAALGLELERILDDDVAELGGAAQPIYLLRNQAETPTSSGGSATRRYDRHWTPVHLDFVVDDLEAAARRAEAAGAIREHQCPEWRGARCISLADPFGHGFCLIAFEGDSYA